MPVEKKHQKKALAKILVVEDDKGIATMLETVLLEEGYDVVLANDGMVALQVLTDMTPDLVLLDLHVPHRSGFELLKDIRRRDLEYGVFIPVIVLTGVYTSRQDKVDSLDAGADDFLSKPFDLIELLARVRSLLRVQVLYKKSQFLATHDPLTRCYNRRYLIDFMDREYARFKRYKKPFSFLLLDLDHFKAINDQEGHEAGDQVLLYVGFRLQDFFRAIDCVARLGGDEFAAVLPDCRTQEAAKVGDRLIKFMTAPSNKKELPPQLLKKIGLSIGIASLPDHAKDPEELVKMADEAMYAAKKAGRNQFKMAA